MTPEQALEEARTDKLRPVYLLIGEESHQIAEVVAALKKAALVGGVPGLNEDVFEASETDVDAVLAAVRTLPMLAKRRFVLVRGLERWDGKDAGKGKEPLEKLIDYAKNPLASAVVVLVAPALDKRRRLVNSARGDGWLVNCEALRREDLPLWIERAVRARGNTISQHAADLIAELAGPELAPVADAVERLCLYAGSSAEVTEDAVGECLVRLRPASVWDLVNAVGRRNAGAALAALERVYDPSDRGLPLVSLLARSVRQLLKFDAAVREGAAPPEAAARAGAPPFKARELAQQVKVIPRAELERWLVSLAELDAALKGGSKRLPKSSLEFAILSMCGMKQRPGRGAAAGSSA